MILTFSKIPIFLIPPPVPQGGAPKIAHSLCGVMQKCALFGVFLSDFQKAKKCLARAYVYDNEGGVLNILIISYLQGCKLSI